MQKITSSFLSLDTHDLIKGSLVAAGSAVFTLVARSVENGQFTFDFTAIWHTALAAAVAYLGKNLFTPAKAVKQLS